MFCSGRPAVFSLIFSVATSLFAADEFGDVSISAAAMYTGNTFHGYGEIDVTLENRSGAQAHTVSLTFPNNSWNNGNSIGSLTRTVTLEPDTRESVLLLQPPLPANGDSSIRVEVDGHHEGEVHAPNANSHCSNYSGRGGQATVFVSRSLNYDAVEHVFNASHGGFTAAMAIGTPDASGYGMQSVEWVPDTRQYGQSNWLELDYTTPQVVNHIVIYGTQSLTVPGGIVLIGTGGTNIETIPMTSGRNSSSGSGWTKEFTFSDTVAPVKTVRLEFGTARPYSIAVDAVEVSGATNSQWASDARASSDNSAAAGSYTSGGEQDATESLRAESPVAEWSENWLAYSPFDAVVLSDSDLNSMSPAVLTAVGDYLQAGGNVVLPGRKDLPAAWHSYAIKSLKDGVEYSVGFGRCFVLNAEDPGSFSPKTVQALRDTVRDAAHYWRGLPDDVGAANNAMPVVQNLKIPTRGIVIIMIAFIVIIGPVNIVYLTRHRRRTWMLWTIPVISLFTTLVVFAYSLLREGITPDTRIAGLTLIDQVSHHTATIGATAFYCPLTPGGGLHFDYETEATPLVHAGYGSGASREVDWTQSQHFSHGWISARVPAHFHLRKSGTGRERIQVVNVNGKREIINGLGAPLKSLWFADADMNIYEATDVAAGQKAGLIPSHQLHFAEDTGANGLLSEISYVANPEALSGIAVKYLTPNTYIAVLDGNPFIENALGPASSPKRTKSSAVVFGILEPSEPK
jgi:hypothetical protein